MARVTKAQLERQVAHLNKLIPNAGFEIDWAYNMPRLDKGGSHCSPRLRIGLLSEWVHAYRQGAEAIIYKPTNGS